MQHWNFMVKNKSKFLFIFFVFSHTNGVISWNAFYRQLPCFDVMGHIYYFSKRWWFWDRAQTCLFLVRGAVPLKFLINEMWFTHTNGRYDLKLPAYVAVRSALQNALFFSELLMLEIRAVIDTFFRVDISEVNYATCRYIINNIHTQFPF